MIEFPITTSVGKTVPKTAFYKHLEVNARMKRIFVNDVERIVWANKFAPTTLNVSDGKFVHEITVFNVLVKNKDCPSDIFVFIDKNIPRHTVFILTDETECSVVINYKEEAQGTTGQPYKVTNTYQSPWMHLSEISLPIEGNTMDALYENMVRHVAGVHIIDKAASLKEDIEVSEKQEQLRKEIAALKKKLALERQPTKKFALHKKLKELEKQLKTDYNG